MDTSKDKSFTDRKIKTAAKIQGSSDYEAPRASDDTRNFIETHAVTKVARKAAPGAGEESADLLPTEPVDQAHDDRDASLKV